MYFFFFDSDSIFFHYYLSLVVALMHPMTWSPVLLLVHFSLWCMRVFSKVSISNSTQDCSRVMNVVVSTPDPLNCHV